MVALRRPLATFIALGLALAGCPSEPRPTDKPKPSATASVALPPPPPSRTLLDVVDALAGCDVEHAGLLLDGGTNAMTGRFAWSAEPPQGMAPVEHDGSTWSRVVDKKLSLAFFLEEASRIEVSTRAEGYGAKTAQVLLDEQPLGTLTFAKNQIRIAKTETTTLPADAGLHVITLRFGTRTKDADALADLDWVRIGPPEDAAAATTYGPPTMRDVIAPAAALSGVPHRSLALRAPGTVRCALRAPARASLRTAVGLQGTGSGEAEVRLLRDGAKPDVRRTIALDTTERATWLDLDIPLGEETGGKIVGLELRAIRAPKGARVLFGDPAIVLPGAEPPRVPAARAVVIVVLDNVERAEVPPWAPGPTPHLAALNDLVANATTYDRHRAPTTVVPAVIATLLTGLSPAQHGMADPNARLPATATTLGGIARDAGVRTAMFTGVPYTFRAFGFSSGWEKFAEIAPSSGEPATAPIDQAAQWLGDVAKATSDGKMLALVHARGSHPPWDVTPKELGAAPPPDYSGIIDPRRAAQTLAKMRKRRAREHLGEGDRIRIRSLETIALAGQDRALGALVASLKTIGLWDATLLIVTGDVASGADPSSFYADGLDLRETLLDVPLYVHFPGGAFAGRHAAEPTEMADVTATALLALGLSQAKSDKGEVAGRDLLRVAADGEEGRGPPLVATLDDRYSVRWGDVALNGKFPNAPHLCDLVLDPTCAFDRREAMPYATIAIFRKLAALPAAIKAPIEKREPATIDADTAAALRVWGAIE